MLVSVIVPAYNAQKTLDLCLKAILQSRFRDYELLVVDDGSTDKTQDIAKRYADHILTHPQNLGRSYARATGMEHARGEILVFIDSDVMMSQDTLDKIANLFSGHNEVDAVTGLLSKDHPHKDFFSQYKNLYMNFVFSRLPERVSFLYGSIFALRRSAVIKMNHDIALADDTVLGQKLSQNGKRIAFLMDLEVIHLKKYDFWSWVKNDFQIPFDWAKILIKYQGWKILGKNKAGYFHSPKKQLLSVSLIPVLLGMSLASFFYPVFHPSLVILIFLWVFLNVSFFYFLARERGFLFASVSVPITLLDHGVMASGIVCGLLKALQVFK